MKRYFSFNMRGISLVLVTLVLCSLSICVSAAPPGSCQPWPQCKDDGDNGSSMTVPIDVSANWSFAEGLDYFLQDQTPRLCECNGTPSNGYVGCACPSGGWVHVTLERNTGNWSGQDLELCGLLENLWLGGDNKWIGEEYVGLSRITAYHFTMDPTWNDGICVGGDSASSCLVRVRITAYFDDWCEGRKCGRLLLLRGWGDADPEAVESGELNPFVVPQRLNIHYLEVQFMGIGKNRGVALCEYGGLNEFDRSKDTGITWIVEPPIDP